MRAERWLPAATLAGLALLYLALFRPGLSVMGGGDFALYLAHAQALAQGRPYAETFFVFNPANAIMSPAAYPPGLPLLLAPVVAVFGLAATPIKLMMLAALLAMLWLLHKLAEPVMGPRWSAVLVLAAGLSPALLMRRDSVGSDVVFTAWCYLALLGARGRPLLLGIGVAMAILTRSIGVVLAAALALDLLFRPGPMRRRLAPALLAGIAVAAVGTLALRADNATYVGYFDRLSADGLLRHLASAGQAYAFAVVELFGLSFGRLANMPVLLGLLGLIGWGLWRQLRRGPDALTIFVVLYGAALIAYPVHLEPTRYALPILPLLIYLALEPPRWLPPATVLLVLASLYGPYYAQHSVRAQAPVTTDSPEFQALLAELRENPPGTRLITRNPRIFALYAGLPSHTWPETLTPEAWRTTLLALRPAYVIEELWQRSNEAQVLSVLVAGYPISFENAAYRLRAIPAEATGR